MSKTFKKCGTFSCSGLNFVAEKKRKGKVKRKTKNPHKNYYKNIWNAVVSRVYRWCDPFIVGRDRYVQVSPCCFLFFPRGVMA